MITNYTTAHNTTRQLHDTAEHDMTTQNKTTHENSKHDIITTIYLVKQTTVKTANQLTSNLTAGHQAIKSVNLQPKQNNQSKTTTENKSEASRIKSKQSKQCQTKQSCQTK